MSDLENRAVCVLGMSRNGTSIVTALLDMLGVYLGPSDTLNIPEARQLKGYRDWEHQEIAALNAEILRRVRRAPTRALDWPNDWPRSPELDPVRLKARDLLQRDFGSAELWGWKDPATCLTLPFWQMLVPSISYVICVRNPRDSARSFTRAQVKLRDHYVCRAVDSWLTHVAAALVHTAAARRHVVFYEDVLADKEGEVERLARFLSIDGGMDTQGVRERVHELVAAKKWHYRSALDEVLDDRNVHMEAKSLYSLLLAARRTEADEGNGVSNGDPLALPTALAQRLYESRYHRPARRALTIVVQSARNGASDFARFRVPKLHAFGRNALHRLMRAGGDSK